MSKRKPRCASGTGQVIGSSVVSVGSGKVKVSLSKSMGLSAGVVGEAGVVGAGTAFDAGDREGESGDSVTDTKGLASTFNVDVAAAASTAATEAAASPLSCEMSSNGADGKSQRETEREREKECVSENIFAKIPSHLR